MTLDQFFMVFGIVTLLSLPFFISLERDNRKFEKKYGGYRR
jgi:hypothetical protein